MKKSIGIRTKDSYGFYTEITKDAVRKFYSALGLNKGDIPDEIPLTFIQSLTTGHSGGGEGLHAVITGETYTLKNKLSIGDNIIAYVTCKDIRKVESTIFNEAIFEEDSTEVFNQHNILLATLDTKFLRFRRETKPERRDQRIWTEGELEEICQKLEEQKEPINLKLGDEFKLLSVGPYTTEDFIAWQAATGAAPFIRAFDERLRVARKVPGLYFKDQFGSPMSYGMVHWDTNVANKIGASSCFDFGRQRAALVERGLMRFKDYQVVELDIRLNTYIYVGDLISIRGKVSGINTEDGVTIDFWLVNQNGKTNGYGYAKLIRRGGLSQNYTP